MTGSRDTIVTINTWKADGRYRERLSVLTTGIGALRPGVVALQEACTAAGRAAPIEGLSCWTDAALLTAAGIPAICYGPGDIILAHADEEWIPLDEVERATRVLSRLAQDGMRGTVA